MLPRSKKFFQLPLSLVSFIFLSSILIQISDYRSYNYCIILFFTSTASSFYYHLSNTSFHIQSISNVFLFLPTAVLILDFLSILWNFYSWKQWWSGSYREMEPMKQIYWLLNQMIQDSFHLMSTVSWVQWSPLKTPLCRYFLITFGPRVA